MKKNLQNQFGTTGIADAGAYGRVHAGPTSLRHRFATPMGVAGTPSGDEQLR